MPEAQIEGRRDIGNRKALRSPVNFLGGEVVQLHQHRGIVGKHALSIFRIVLAGDGQNNTVIAKRQDALLERKKGVAGIFASQGNTERPPLRRQSRPKGYCPDPVSGTYGCCH